MDKKYKGVTQQYRKYLSKTTVPLYLGSFDTHEEAARAYDAAQFFIHGRRGNFNFHDNIHIDNIEVAARLFLSRHNIDGGRESLALGQIREFAEEYAKSTSCAPSNGTGSGDAGNNSPLVKDSMNPDDNDKPSNAQEDPTKRLVNGPSDHLLKEIKEINQRIMEVMVEVMNIKDEGTLVTVYYVPFVDSQQMFPNLHLELMLKADYPNSSPVMVETLPPDLSGAEEEKYVCMKAKSDFRLLLRTLPEPVSLKEIAEKWESCARVVYNELANRQGGGDCSSTQSNWNFFGFDT